MLEHKKQSIVNECKFSAVRSSGPGGQNVNKVNTKIELRFSIENSNVFTNEEKQLLYLKLKNRININGELTLSSQNTRSQLKNKENAIELLTLLLENALKIDKKRIRTKPSYKSKQKRLDNKKRLSEKKRLRRRNDW